MILEAFWFISGFILGAAENKRTGLSFGCGEVSVSCAPDLLLVVERVNYLHGTECDGSGPTADHPPPPSGLSKEEENVEIWNAVVSQCSGYKRNSCNFNLNDNFPHYSGGRLEVQYTCATGIYSYCGGNVKADSGGYISSPGYPKYYLGGKTCVWNISGEIGQHLEVTLLDTSFSTEDCMEVKESGDTVLRECGKLVEIKRYISTSHQLQIRTINLQNHQQIQSRRGLLVRYKTIGCAAPAPIADGNVSFANQTYAEYVCNKGHVFKSTLTPFRSMQCSGNKWVEKLEHCVSLEFLLQYGSEEMKNSLVQFSHSQLTQKNEDSESEWKLEVGATVTVGLLLLVSLAIALILYAKYSETGTYRLQDDQISLKEVQHGQEEETFEKY